MTKGRFNNQTKGTSSKLRSTKKNKQKRSGVRHDATLQEQVKQDLAKAKIEKQEKDNALNALKKQQLADKEQVLRIKQILTHHQIKNVGGDNDYNYTFGSKIKKLSLDLATHKALVNGRLSLCGLDDVTYLVTRETADQLAELDKNVVLVQNDMTADDFIDEDDPYADYQIPDDLMW
ncbi:DUF2058 domain-containing protein [Colwellia sp. MSW7]|uniref:DUF2058 domain-containing protein n=1 Tax=Colwellia maritima TaxID=2912588 RepID=A0ABS9X5Z9_9GAMM|nr:DUF2058 domain-containing protein [Colwellia maritima]